MKPANEKEKGEIYRWSGDARVLWPDDTVSHYTTFRGARIAMRKRGFSRNLFASLDSDHAIVVTDVWVERWFKEKSK
jgi:hypothetical protein